MAAPATPKRKLELDLRELEAAFEQDTSWEVNHYLDLETGRVVSITSDTRQALEDLYQELDDEGADQTDWQAAIQQRDLPDWEKNELLLADQVEAGYGTRYIRIPEADSHQAYKDMQDFATVQKQSLQDRLWNAISGRGAFRYFKDVLAEDHRERERWFKFQDECTRRRVLDWLESQGIEPIYTEPEPPPPPPIRAHLITGVLNFVRAASQLPGVTRIALIGSLTTAEPDPKDADVLVTVTEEADIEPLAKLGRRLAGHAQQLNRGGDIFLADPQGNYLGRTCPWKLCGPGIRQSCDALHCGQRPYLHDDLKTIKLAKRLIAAPPIELWPQIVARVPVPKDVEQGLITPLKEQNV